MHICSRPSKENSSTATDFCLKFLPCQKNTFTYYLIYTFIYLLFFSSGSKFCSLFLIRFFVYYYFNFLIKGLLQNKCFWLKKHHDPSQPFLKLMTVVIEFWNFLKFYQTFIFFETERHATFNNS